MPQRHPCWTQQALHVLASAALLSCHRLQPSAATVLPVQYIETKLAAHEVADGIDVASQAAAPPWHRQLVQRRGAMLSITGNLTLGYYQAQVAMACPCALMLIAGLATVPKRELVGATGCCPPQYTCTKRCFPWLSSMRHASVPSGRSIATLSPSCTPALSCTPAQLRSSRCRAPLRRCSRSLLTLAAPSRTCPARGVTTAATTSALPWTPVLLARTVSCSALTRGATCTAATSAASQQGLTSAAGAPPQNARQQAVHTCFEGMCCACMRMLWTSLHTSA